MAFATVNPLAELWRSAGLKYFLVSSEFLDLKKASHARLLAESRLRARPEKAERKTPILVEKTETQPPVPKQTWRPLAPEAWPQAMQILLKSTRPGLFAWTYRELGADLAFSRIGVKEGDDQKRKQRGKFLRDLFQKLAFPAGTHCLWPVNVAETMSLDEQTQHELFWSAIARLGCRGVIVFGSAAASLILPGQTLKPLSSVRMHGVPVVVLWDINGLAEKDVYLGKVHEYLRTFLRQINFGARI